MSLKRLRIEQLCPSIDSMFLLFLYTTPLCNRKSNENRVQYVNSKTDDTLPPTPHAVIQYTVRDRKHKNLKKKFFFF